MPMLPLITTKVKDDVLQWLCANVRPGHIIEIDQGSLLEILNVDADSDTLLALFEDFEELGLLDSLTSARNGSDQVIILALKIKAHDLLQRGGFSVLDALNEANMQKLLFELENLRKQLKPDQVDTFNKITAIASSLATVLAAFSSKQ